MSVEPLTRNNHADASASLTLNSVIMVDKTKDDESFNSDDENDSNRSTLVTGNTNTNHDIGIGLGLGIAVHGATAHMADSHNILLMNASLEILCTKRPIDEYTCNKFTTITVHKLLCNSFAICEDFMEILNDECLTVMKEHFVKGMVSLSAKASVLETTEHFQKSLQEMNEEYDYVINCQKLLLLARMKIFCTLYIEGAFQPKQVNGNGNDVKCDFDMIKKKCRSVMVYMLQRKVFQRAFREEYATDFLSYMLRFRHDANDRMLICKEVSLLNSSLIKFTGAKVNLTHPLDDTLLLNKIRPTIQFAIRGHKSTINAMVFSKTHGRCYTCGDDRYIRTWDVSFEVPVLIHKIVAHHKKINTLLISDTKRCIFTSSNDGCVCVWDIKADILVLISKLDNHTSDVCSIGINNTCTRLVSSSFDNTMIVWAMPTKRRRPVFCYEITDMYPNMKVAISDRAILYAGSLDGTLSVYNVERTPSQIGTLLTHGGTITSMFLDEAKNVLYTGSRDTTFIIWNTSTDTPTCYQRITTRGIVFDICLHPTNSQLYIATSDMKVTLYDMDEDTKECHVLSKYKKLGKSTGVHSMCPIYNKLYCGLAHGTIVEHIQM